MSIEQIFTLYLHILGSNPVLFFAACEKRSCVSIGVGSFSVHLERTPGLDSRINLCDDIGTLFNGIYTITHIYNTSINSSILRNVSYPIYCQFVVCVQLFWNLNKQCIV